MRALPGLVMFFFCKCFVCLKLVFLSLEHDLMSLQSVGGESGRSGGGSVWQIEVEDVVEEKFVLQPCLLFFS